MYSFLEYMSEMAFAKSDWERSVFELVEQSLKHVIKCSLYPNHRDYGKWGKETRGFSRTIMQRSWLKPNRKRPSRKHMEDMFIETYTEPMSIFESYIDEIKDDYGPAGMSDKTTEEILKDWKSHYEGLCRDMNVK